MLSKHKFVIEVLDATRRGRTHGVLSIVTVKGKKVKTSRLRAIVRVTGVKSRVYGERRLSALQAVRSVLSMMTKKINRDEIKRVLVAVQAVHGAGIGDSQDSNPKCVQIIHQIYGVFRDDKPMPDLFQKPLSEWQRIARIMGAIHHLWNADELDALIKHWYPQFWPMYRNAPFSVMRADIGRVAILHRFGGLYADLDVLPNRQSYPLSMFAVQKVFITGYKTAMKKWARVKTNSSRAYSTASGMAAGMYPKPVRKHYKLASKHPVAQKSNVIDMEVLISEKGNPLLLRWLAYMQTRIHALNYAHTAHWQTWKMTYIHHATGPKCLQKFLQAKDNVDIRNSLQVVSCNNFAEANELSTVAKYMFDVISYQSQSYFTERDPYQSRVGFGGDVDDVPKLEAVLTDYRRQTVSEAAHPHPVRRVRTKCSAAIMTTVPSVHMEMQNSTHPFFVSAGCCEPKDLLVALTIKEAAKRAAILLEDQSATDREWTLQMDAWAASWLEGKAIRQTKQYEYETGLEAKGSRCIVYADIVKDEQQEAPGI